MGLLADFKQFAMKGNVLDLATAVIIGGAFGKITSSLVNDVVMPPIGLLLGKVNFKELKFVLQEGQPAIMNGDQIVSPEVVQVAISYGMFFQNIIDFVLIAFAVFMIIKIYQKLQNENVEAPAPAPPAPSNEELLLAEIRDLLKQK